MKLSMIWILLPMHCLPYQLKFKKLKHSSYVCGDYNIALLKVKDNKLYCEYFDEIISHEFFLKITLPTRICESTSTLIDNIFTNNIDVPDSSRISLNQISDHQNDGVYIG